MIVYSSTQAPQCVQEVVARVLGKPMHAVEARMRRAGGAFGAKATRNLPHAAAAAMAAQVTPEAVPARVGAPCSRGCVTRAT
jgi:xanthine dehydrogenase large subunit